MKKVQLQIIMISAIIAAPLAQGDRMSVYFLVELHNPASKTFSRC
ncbi:hypothetical protein Sps_01241 [Shewanella psychrophila]|uniref:Uncharacterized protein n=1 Tax=Shewanella psychrophila TaxID=225848 RepID=A0A1S6HLL6_9GAMM|nr:hypothetical protein Sps_01241 [Shewanella psychrophila]